MILSHKDCSVSVNLVTPDMDGYGIGEAAKGLAHSLDAAGIPHARFSLGKDDLSQLPHALTIIHANPTQLHSDPVRRSLAPLLTQRERTIGYWAWESVNTFDPQNWPCFTLFREIWAPSRFASNCLARVSPIPVYTIPHAVHRPRTQVASHNRNADRPFTLLLVFDHLSLAQRKNPEASIKAVAAASAQSDCPIKLIIKTRNLPQQIKKELQLLLPESLAVRWVDRHLSRLEMDHLLGEVDALISLHRAEGFGLTLAEAMACGKPVIATDYSGNLDFMNADNSMLIPWLPVCVSVNERNHFSKGTLWAEADPLAAAAAIRELVADPLLAARLGQRAAETIGAHFSAEAIGRMLHRRLARAAMAW
jgi:glycosyltransferase involved in cell wall biosynthesis